MKLVFVDSSYYVALFNRTDRFHERATQLARTLKHRPIATEFVLLEVGNICSRGKGRELFGDLLRRLRRNPKVIIVPASRELFQRGYELYAGRRDKDWSLTDCTSFVVMKERGLTDALTTDRHFEQAGFTMLLK
ncbi:MAG: PIN domain-containing protein [Planctomycetes bacterium]|nr:PIN domain-containing protein [Planctomycetota bacterium]MBU4400818.1 PIN domain-containing protein [Planctomycetota bacterium]MCG2682930.1 PIN domain-containing protein [Planctomycetales bacterium]